MNMSFRVEMDRPIIRGTHYISPGGYCLSFWLNGGVRKDVEFDFTESSGNIIGGKFVDFCVSGLDTEAFPESSRLTGYLRNYSNDWIDFFIYTGERSDAEINPVKVTNIVISDGSKDYHMKDFVFVDRGEHILSDKQFNIISNIMERPLKFCASHPLISKGGDIRFYESNGKIYLCSLTGVGYCYNTRSGNVGSIRCSGGVEAAKGLIMDVVSKLIRQIPFPVKSISMPCKQFTGGYYRKSTEEEDAYDIILK